LEPGRYIDPVAKNVLLIDDDVALMNTYPERDALIDQNLRIALHHCGLDCNRAAHGIDDTRELDEHAIACRPDNATMVGRNHRIDKSLAVRLERLQRPDFVGTH
jgi:hypothetical protein